MMNFYEDLAHAIILRAVEDYREILQRWSRNPGKKQYQWVKDELECFFRSDWFGVLTKIDPEALIERLNKEVA